MRRAKHSCAVGVVVVSQLSGRFTLGTDKRLKQSHTDEYKEHLR